MTYSNPTSDDTSEVDSRIYPGAMRCLKLSSSNVAAYKLLPRNVKTATLYSSKAHWVRVDLVSADPVSARDLEPKADNVIYVPAGTFVIAQRDEFNCISALSTDGNDTVYIYTGGASDLNGLVSEDLQE